VRKVLPWLLLAAAFIWISQNPAGAADDIRNLLAAASSFISHL
jgi:hypothetical protein